MIVGDESRFVVSCLVPKNVIIVRYAPRDKTKAIDDLWKVIALRRTTTVLGRSDIDVRIDDPDVSRKHVAIELQGAGPHLAKDLGSTNGTLLNGVKLTEAPLAPNDSIRMGSTKLKLVKGEHAVTDELKRLSES